MINSRLDGSSIKVLHVLNDLSHGGAESFVFSLLEEAKLDGHHFGVMLLHLNADCMNKQRKEVLWSKSIDAYQLKGAGGFFRAIKKFNPDVIHCHNLKALLICLVAKMLFWGRIKIVFTQHTSFLKRKYFHRLIYRFVDAYCAICEVARKDFESVVPNKKIYLARNGIKETITANQSMRVEGKCNVGMIARFHPVKNHDLLVESAVLLKKNNQIDFFKFTLIGDGECKGYIEDKVRKSGCGDAFHFAGSRENASQYIAGFDYLILCSKNEGLPITILEALQMKTPIIATNVGGVADLVKDGENGFLVESDSAVLLANTLLKAKNKEIQSRFCDHFERNDFGFTVRASLKKHLEIYSSLLNV